MVRSGDGRVQAAGGGANGASTGAAGSCGAGIGRFLMAVDECEFALETAIEDLTVNSFSRETGFRSERAVRNM